MKGCFLKSVVWIIAIFIFLAIMYNVVITNTQPLQKTIETSRSRIICPCNNIYTDFNGDHWVNDDYGISYWVMELSDTITAISTLVKTGKWVMWIDAKSIRKDGCLILHTPHDFDTGVNLDVNTAQWVSNGFCQ